MTMMSRSRKPTIEGLERRDAAAVLIAQATAYPPIGSSPPPPPQVAPAPAPYQSYPFIDALATVKKFIVGATPLAPASIILYPLLNQPGSVPKL